MKSNDFSKVILASSPTKSTINVMYCISAKMITVNNWRLVANYYI